MPYGRRSELSVRSSLVRTAPFSMAESSPESTEWPGHAHRSYPRDDSGYCDRLQLTQNVSCATAACMVMHPAVFEDAGRFDERSRGLEGVRAAGGAESSSRYTGVVGSLTHRFAAEVACVKERWEETLDRDPYYNPNLTLDGEDFGLAFPSRARRPWSAPRR